MKGSRAAVGAFALALCSAACGGAAGYRTLTFFFDGVPPPGESGAARKPGDASPAAAPARVVEHGPYAAKLCGGCHEPGRGNVLVVPAEQLCGRCHTLGAGKKFVHGPLNAGGCLVCHDPHSSPNPYMLVAVSGESCLRCHERRSLGAVAGHAEGGGACTACHEAHMSDSPYLLR
jgi:predicted CXXCH cytochrome family protein